MTTETKTEANPPYTNRLIHETSPYLLQHAHNPVEWYAWGQEAFDKAQSEDKPIHLSVGYSACHWCHVLAHESFEDPATAQMLNEHYVNIKVDREERPDIDQIYMEAVQLLTRRGGWPMTVFLTPTGQPYYGGTYFPPVERHGLPSFQRVLLTMADAYRTRRQEVLEQAAAISQQISQTFPLAPADGLAPSMLDQAAEQLIDMMDATRGGLRGAPKFPQPMLLEFLLRQWRRTGDATARALVDLTLEAMARGGIYDQIGGGFARYSVDDEWLVPHFEKMLYDNAQLARLYLDAFRATGRPLYRQVVEATLDYVTRELTGPEGGFYSAQDADSEGVEGKFYVWTAAEIAAALSPPDATTTGQAAHSEPARAPSRDDERIRIVIAYYGVTEHGNFEEKNILSVPRSTAAVAAELGLSAEAVTDAVAWARPHLYAARARRIWPGRDDKLLTGWNGLMLRAFAEAARALGRADYLATARRNADFVLTTLQRPDGRLLRTYRAGQAKLIGYLEDQAAYADGLLALYEATYEPRYFEAARALAEAILAHYADREQGGFFDTADDAEALITRPKNLYDNAVPSGNSLAAELLLRLAALTGDGRYQTAAGALIEGLAGPMTEHPTAFGRLLCAFDLYLNGAIEVALVGEPADAATRALIETLAGSYQPNAISALRDPSVAGADVIPLLSGRSLVNGQPAAYLCRGFACRQPVTTPAALAAELAG